MAGFQVTTEVQIKSGFIPPICLFMALWRLEPRPCFYRFRIKSIGLAKRLKPIAGLLIAFASVQHVGVNYLF